MAGHFASLLTNQAELSRVTLAFEKTIRASYESHPVRHSTQAEISRRFEICARIFEQLRGDLEWGLERIFDKLPEYLGAELNGSTWEPDKRTCWMPSDG